MHHTLDFCQGELVRWRGKEWKFPEKAWFYLKRFTLPQKRSVHDEQSHLRLGLRVCFEIFVKAMPPNLSELKVLPSFCFAIKIPDDEAASSTYMTEWKPKLQICTQVICVFFNFRMPMNMVVWSWWTPWWARPCSLQRPIAMLFITSPCGAFRWRKTSFEAPSCSSLKPKL